MATFLAGRILAGAVALVAVSILIFVLIRLVPGDIIDASIGNNTTSIVVDEELLAEMRAQFGLNDPVPVQYMAWVGDILQGDLGTSWRQGKPIADLIVNPLLTSLQLAIMVTILALIIGIVSGVAAALRHNQASDHAIRFVSVGLLAIPSFWLGTVLILFMSLQFRWIPPIRYVPPWVDLGTNMAIMALPLITLGIAFSAALMRFTRASMLEVLGADYITTARAKGLGQRVVLRRHALRNALIPVITAAGLQMGWLIGGLVVVEQVFAIPGLGRFLLQAIEQRDYPVIQIAVVTMAFIFILANLIVDALYFVIDPRIRTAR